MIFNAMFDAGENVKHSLRWKLFDTPPVKKWLEMFETTSEQRRPGMIDILEMNFCRSKDEAEFHWKEFQVELEKIWPTHWAIQTSFDVLSNVVVEQIKDELFKALEYERKEVDDALYHLKYVMFWCMHRGMSSGQIYHLPEPRLCVDWDPEWSKYLTMDTNPGWLYAEVTFHVNQWPFLVGLDPTQHYDLLITPNLGMPVQLGNGFISIFGPDMNAHKNALSGYLGKYENKIKEGNPNFSAATAIANSGRLPLGELVESPGYDQLKSMKKIFKLEIFDSWI